MSYAPITARRSTRYPLAGDLGCACSAPPARAMGQTTDSTGTSVITFAAGFGIATAGLIGVGVGYYLGKTAERARSHLRANRRHRRHRRN